MVPITGKQGVVGGGGHRGPSRLHNFPRLKYNFGPKVLRKEFSTPKLQQNCSKIAAKHPIVFNSGLEIEFYPFGP